MNPGCKRIGCWGCGCLSIIFFLAAAIAVVLLTGFDKKVSEFVGQYAPTVIAYLTPSFSTPTPPPTHEAIPQPTAVATLEDTSLVQELLQRKSSLNREVANLNNEIESLEEELKNATEQKTALELQITEKKGEVIKLETELASLTTALNGRSVAVEAAQIQLSSETPGYYSSLFSGFTMLISKETENQGLNLLKREDNVLVELGVPVLYCGVNFTLERLRSDTPDLYSKIMDGTVTRYTYIRDRMASIEITGFIEIDEGQITILDHSVSLPARVSERIRGFAALNTLPDIRCKEDGEMTTDIFPNSGEIFRTNQALIGKTIWIGRISDQYIN